MKCKFCQQELEENVFVCPACGADNTLQEEQETVEPAELDEVLESLEETEEVQTEENLEAPEAEQKKKRKVFPVWIAITAGVLVLLALAALLLHAFGVWDQLLRPNDINKKDCYTAESEDQAVNAADKVVVEITTKSESGETTRKLTNGMLQMYYRKMVVDFINQNSSYLSYMGLDYNKPLAEQTCYYDESLTWEKYFLKGALETWQNYQIVYASSVQAGFQPSQDIVQSLDSLPKQLEDLAKEEKLASADALIRDRFGATVSLENYLEYMRVYMVGAEYVNQDPTAEDVAKYYTDNEEMFKSEGVDKAAGNMVNVRHILLQPQGGVADEDTETIVYSDAEWAACLKAAEELLQQWKDGKATEESFAELATKNSTDGGSKDNGGLYTGITSKTSFVKPFLDWCMDDARKVGDTGIVKTEYGYHIMFFAYTQPQWEYYARIYLLSERTEEMLNSAKESWEFETSYNKILLPPLDLK